MPDGSMTQPDARRPPGLYPALKRAFDILASVLLLALAAPVLACAAVAVAVGSGRPVLFRQARLGRHGRRIQVYKLRTMRGPVIEGSDATDGSRLTAVGRWLRRFSLDELPQLWNVLRGEMSLVGPRPLLACYEGRFGAAAERRHAVRPGLTGLAQVRGRNALGWNERFALDTWYVDHASFRLDTWILLRTPFVVLLGSGLAHPGHATMPALEIPAGREQQP